MPKLLLHIGPHKTGSTYIQKYFFDNRDKLLELGVNYPNIGFGGQYGQHEIVERIKKLEPEQLLEYIANVLTLESNFISSENFDRLNAGDIEKLRAGLTKIPNGTDVRIVYFHRNYSDLLPSWWQEEVKHGSIVSFYEFILPHVLRPFSSNIVNPAIVLDLYANVFGKASITIIDYDRARGNILLPIFQLLGIEVGDVKNEIINSSLQIEFVEIIRSLNAIAKANNQWSIHRTRALFLRKRRESEIAKEVEELAALIRDYLKPLRVAGGFFEKTVSANFKSNYESCFFNKQSEELPDRTLMIPSDNWLLNQNALKMCEHIYQHIMTGDVSY